MMTDWTTSIAAAAITLSLTSATEQDTLATTRPVAELQADFRKLKFGMFIHYNMATYLGVEWVTGYPDPSTFDPGGRVDTDAWADAAVSAGMTYGVLTAKHVGGFCLWDSEHTTYDVLHPDCPYQEDLVAQFVESFTSRGLKAGLYYCWRHPGFGDPGQHKVLPPECDPATHSLEEQNEFAMAQIAELVAKYPDVFYIWNDALDDEVMPAGEVLARIHSHRPDVLCSSNWWDWGKKGTPYVDIAVKEMRPFPETNTTPGETCWKLEQSWFWKQGARSGSAEGLAAHRTTALARSSNFLLNVGPDRSGRIIDSSIATLAAIGQPPFALPAAPKEIPAQLPDPDDEPPATDRPVKVYLLYGQSNMVGMGDIRGRSTRWGREFLAPEVSIHPGEYSPTADYDAMTPLETLELESFGGTRPTPFPKGGTAVVRGFIEMEQEGAYEFNAGYGRTVYSIMEVDGTEVYRREPGSEEADRTAVQLSAGRRVPFRITFLTEHADGLGWVWRTDIPGLLSTLVHQDGKFPHLVDDEGRWTVRNDVTYKGVISAVAQGPLTVGLQGNTIGPELQFGHVMGYYHDEPVLLIKASIGNRSLGWDYLPPGSERYTVDGTTYAGYEDSPSSWPEGTEPEPIDWYAGKQYDDCVKATHEVLNDFAELFPQYAEQGYEIAGFVWWQGHKDGNPIHASRYEENLVNLIRCLRAEFEVPEAPFVLATIGFGGWEMAGPHLIVADAQLAVSGETGEYPELAGNVKTVEIRDYWRDRSVSPSGQGYHYNRNAETYLMVGDALGRGMVGLLEGR